MTAVKSRRIFANRPMIHLSPENSFQSRWNMTLLLRAFPGDNIHTRLPQRSPPLHRLVIAKNTKKRALLLGKPVAFDFFEIPVSSACFQACAGFAPAAFKRPRRMSVILPPATTENTYPLLHIQHLLSVPEHCTVRAGDGQVFLASRSKPSSITSKHEATTCSSYRVPAPFWISARASSMPRAAL